MTTQNRKINQLVNIAYGATLGSFIGVLTGLAAWIIWGMYVGGIVSSLGAVVGAAIGAITMLYKTQESVITRESIIHQYGQGDNIAGDKVMGDKINTQINNNPDLLEAAKSIQALLDELSEQYNPNTEKGQNLIRDEAIEAIETNPTLKTRIINALQSAGDTALEGAIGHPIAKIVIAAAKGFLA